jgi:hypothetical protein
MLKQRRSDMESGGDYFDRQQTEMLRTRLIHKLELWDSAQQLIEPERELAWLSSVNSHA